MSRFTPARKGFSAKLNVPVRTMDNKKMREISVVATAGKADVDVTPRGFVDITALRKLRKPCETYIPTAGNKKLGKSIDIPQ